MLTKVVKLLSWLVLTTCMSGAALSTEKVRVALLTTGDMQMAAYSRLFGQFEGVSGIQVELEFYSDITFKKHLSNWLERGDYDLLYWQAGQRLEKLVRDQTIVPIDTFINENLIRRQFRQNGLDSVSYQDRIYALPLGQYIWGFYYNKEIFKSLNLTPPKTWQEFERITEILKENGITPLIQASKDDWPVLAWLDYFSLDIGGPDFRESLKVGSFGSAAHQKKLLRSFDKLVSNNLFFAAGHDWRWDQTIPTILRKRAAMTLLAQFVEGQALSLGNNQVGFFPFPYQSEKFNNNEVAPMEVMVVPTSTTKREELSALLKFIVDYSAIDSLSYDLGWLSVSNAPGADTALSDRMVVANERVGEANSFVQYFDRETTPSIASKWAGAIKQSIGSGSVKPIEQLIATKKVTGADTTKSIENSEKLLSLATVTGVKGGFLAVRMLSKVYGDLGYGVAISRFSSMDAAIKSVDYGSDGELVRVVDIPALDNKVVKVPVPLATTRVYLVGAEKLHCDLTDGRPNRNPFTEEPSISTVSESLRLIEWMNRFGFKQVVQSSSAQAWKALAEKKVDYLLAFETDVFFNKGSIGDGCYTSLESIPAFHYLSVRHAELVEQVALGITNLKNTSNYKQSLKDFGLGVLPEKG